MAVTADGCRAVSGVGGLDAESLGPGYGAGAAHPERATPLASLAVAVTPDSRLAVSASRDGTLKVWDLAMGHERRTLTGHAGGVIAVALHAGRPPGRVRILGQDA